MSQELYTIISLAARYFFIFLLLIIVIRSYIWLKRDNAAFKKYQNSIAAAGVVGEAVVLFGNANMHAGDRLEIYREGIIGSSKNCDMRIISPNISKRLIYYRIEDGIGLYVEPLHNSDISINAFSINNNTRNAYIINGSILKMADVSLQFFFYPGFSIPTLSPSEMQKVKENVLALYYGNTKPPQLEANSENADLEISDINENKEE